MWWTGSGRIRPSVPGVDSWVEDRDARSAHHRRSGRRPPTNRPLVATATSVSASGAGPGGSTPLAGLTGGAWSGSVEQPSSASGTSAASATGSRRRTTNLRPAQAGGAIMTRDDDRDQALTRRKASQRGRRGLELGAGRRPGDPVGVRTRPESRDIVTVKERYGSFIGGREVQSSDGSTFTTSTPRRRSRWPRSPARPRPTSTRPSVLPRAAPSSIVGHHAGPRTGQVPVPDRPHPPGAVREFAVLESMDSGKPIKGAATSTCPWRPPTSGTTPTGPTSSSTPSPVGSPPLGVAAQVIPGTSRC